MAVFCGQSVVLIQRAECVSVLWSVCGSDSEQQSVSVFCGQSVVLIQRAECGSVLWSVCGSDSESRVCQCSVVSLWF